VEGPGRRLTAAVDVLDATVGRVVAAISGLGAGLALTAMTALVVAGIVSRSVFNISLPFTIEYSEYLIPVVGLGGAAYALRHGAHVRADLVLHRFPWRVRKALLLAGYLGGLVYLVVLTVFTLDTALASIDRGYTSIYPSRTPYGYWQLLVPLSLALFALQLAILALKEATSLVADEPDRWTST
jgi:TRAP-type C4-dicarboxylate transport system permease small subunit